MKKDRPRLPRRLQGLRQFGHVGHQPETLLRRRMLERIGTRADWLRQRRRVPSRQVQQRLGRLARQMLGDIENRVFRRPSDIRDPFRRHAILQQLIVGDAQK